jgi:competence protein ComEC
MQTRMPPSKNPFENLTAYTPLLWLALAFLLGILFSSQAVAAVALWLILIGVAVLLAALAILLHPRRSVRLSRIPSKTVILLALSLVAFFLGALRYRLTIHAADAHAIAFYNDRSYAMLVTGTVIDPPDERDTYTNLRLQVSAVNTGDESLVVQGLLLARVPADQSWHYGDVVRLRGHVQTPPDNEDFSYHDYLARQGIHAYMPDAAATLLPFSGGNPILRQVERFKDFAIARLYRLFPDPGASLLAGILLGNDNGLSADVQQAFKNTGMAHIIVISGFNLAILAGLFVTVFIRLLGPRRGAAAAVLGLAFYTVLAGAGASVVRAVIMTGLALFARQVGRRRNGLNTLAATAAIMAAINPNVPWDANFQLSFGATLGLVLYAAPFQEWVTDRLARRMPESTALKISVPLGEFMLFTLAAQLTTLPIMAYQFGRIPLVSLLSSLFILPVQPAVMVLSGLALLLGLVFQPLGQLVAWIAWPFSAYTIRAVEFFNRFPHGVVVPGDFSFLFVVLFYAVLFTLTFARPHFKEKLRPVLAPSGILVGLGLLTYLVWAAALAVPDGRLRLTFFDVGSADAVLVRTPSGRELLIDGGPSPSLLSDALGRRLPPFERQLDWLVVASTAEQEVAALPRVLDRFPPRQALWAGPAEASYSAGELDRWLVDANIPVTQAFPGASLDLGSGARLEILSVSSRGAVLLVEWQTFRMLLPVGSNFDTLAELENGRKIGPVTALLLADSGYAPVNPPDWLAALDPQLAVLSVAAGDPDGLPDQAVLAALQGTTLLRTDRDGWIEVSTDGNSLWVTKEKER